MRWSTLVTLPVLAVGIAATSWADTNDAAFIKAVSDHGITFPSDQAAINVGHLVCREVSNGMSPNEIHVTQRDSGAG